MSVLSKLAYPDTVTPIKQSWFLSWGAVIAYCVLIFFLSGQSDLTLPEPVRFSDKLWHTAEYGVLGWLWARAVTRTWSTWQVGGVLVTTLIFATLYGASDEWHQLYVPGRSADWRDILADALGGTLGGIGYLLWRRLTAGKYS